MVVASAAMIRAAMLTVVCKVPEGAVATYGDIARLAGFPRHARQVGVALRQPGTEVPWHRIVNHEGRISRRGLDGHDDLQRYLLEAEGVVFDAQGRISLSQYRWATAR
ncbi:MGMT family protein [Jeongeupia sp. HS-3]|uniref:MGMT family protein n=1 Tax=Jeongeupia sp. HS-3 TaxID=1009682 RepID=UPI00190FD914|nr:MGMT family protein [Jeongeupia sp. HS-3]